MARVTVEDCIEKIPNRFDLVLVAAQRARGIMKGDTPEIEREPGKMKEKNPVVALREIAADKINIEEVNESIVKKLQRLFQQEGEDLGEGVDADAEMNMVVGEYNEAEGESAGMHVSSPEEEKAAAKAASSEHGFEDVESSIVSSEE